MTVQFVVIPAAGPHRVPDPVVYFAGGPSGSVVAEFASELPDLLNLTVRRDLVLIEQRGTGQSNPLACSAFPGSVDTNYAKVNLMGISDGTVVEQVFLLHHPDRARTITMQSGWG